MKLKLGNALKGERNGKYRKEGYQVTSTKEMEYVKKGLTHQGLTVSIIDKNKASLCVLCPVMLYRVLVKMYPVGETYEKVEETEE